MRHVLRGSSTLPVLGCLCVLLAAGATSVRGQDITIASAFVQYRTYETATQNRFYAWVAFEKAGDRIEATDLAATPTLSYLPDGEPPEVVEAYRVRFRSNPFVYARLEPDPTPPSYVALLGQSGWQYDLSNHPDLAAGTYRFDAETATGGFLGVDLAFPGRTDLTPVLSGTMGQAWEPDGSLVLWWGPPEPFDLDPDGFYQLMFVGPDGYEVFYGRVDPWVTQVRLEPGLIREISNLLPVDPDTVVKWTVQTRRLSEGWTGFNHARSYSNPVDITWVRPPEPVGPITGTVGTQEGGPLPSDTTVSLHYWREEWGSYEEVYRIWVNPDAPDFLFDTTWYGPLTPGTYKVFVSASGYETVESEEHYLGPGDVWDLGTVLLPALPHADSLAGRLVDAWTGQPLRGDLPPFAHAALYRMFGDGWGQWVADQPTDEGGRFQFTTDSMGAPLPVGTYWVDAYAEGYQYFHSESFALAEGEAKDVGDLAMVPYPIGISNIVPCETIPATGGTCGFSFDVVNRTPKRFRGAAWGIVESYGTGALHDGTRFQTASKGTKKPLEKLNLKPGAVQTLAFEFPVPGWLSDWATVCVDVFVGQDPDPLFNTMAEAWLFCVGKTPAGLQLLPPAKAKSLLQEQKAGPKGGKRFLRP